MIKIKNLDMDVHASLIKSFGCYIHSLEVCEDIPNTVDIVLSEHVKLTQSYKTTTLEFRNTKRNIYNYNFVEIKII